ncbi:hypothetical protein [Pedobacter sp. JY14-1]|uniref:hypothetical protein n=1 Tax=Pedobacter sp. JY14-1 TaxID=3034151 RepID=UPI0023E20BB2|nr:hypothetical protein [Pedobacter sp. JY14-1]
MNRNELLLRVYKSADLQGCLHVKLERACYKVPGIAGVWVLVAELVQLGRAVATGAAQDCCLRFCTVYRMEWYLHCCFSGSVVALELRVREQRKFSLQVGAKEFVLAVEGLSMNFPRFF